MTRRPWFANPAVACFTALLRLLCSAFALRLVLTLLGTTGSSLAFSWVQGTAYQREGENLRPLSRVYVAARSSSGQLLATARSRPDGRYQLLNLPAARIVLTAYRPGYYTRLAAGRSGSRIVLDCSSICARSGTDFELIHGAVISGVVVDKLREPIERVRVSARPSGEPSSARQRTQAGQAVTDDRGQFRLAGLRPGAYTLTAQGSAPGSPQEARTVEVEVHEGKQIDGLTITFGGQAAYQVSGVLAGMSPAKGDRVQIRLEGTGGSRQNFATRAGEDSNFHFAAVTEGRYLASAIVAKQGPRPSTRQFLDVVDVRGNIEGLVLRPAATGIVRGTVALAAGTAPSQFQLGFSSNEGFGSRWFRFTTGEPRFEVQGLVPGSYRVEARSSQVYVKGIRQGEDIASADDVTVSSGANRLDIVVAADHSQVYGTIREPRTGRPLPHASVALDGRGRKNLVQADQAGRFLFGKVIPGEYRICAWADIPAEKVEDEVSWEQAGCEHKIIPIDPESQVEIDLRAAP